MHLALLHLLAHPALSAFTASNIALPEGSDRTSRLANAVADLSAPPPAAALNRGERLNLMV